MNLWHDVSRGENTPNEINVIIEVPKGSYNKYEIDKETGLIALDRANYTSSPYPFDYGFMPQSLWDDGDALDVVVMTTHPLNVGILVRVRPVAVIQMIDGGESDFKVICVPVDDRRFEDIHDIGDINAHDLRVFEHFFLTYKQLKGKEAVVKIDGITGKKEAIEAVQRSIHLYESREK